MGPCAKSTVRCTIVSAAGRWIGSNDCANPQAQCPRAPGEDYTKCRTVCAQTGHAEVNAARVAGVAAADGVAYLEGHVYACESCMRALLAIGVRTLVIGPPPQVEA